MRIHWLLLSLAALAAPLCAQFLSLNERQEAEVGKRAAAEIEMDQPLVTDTQTVAYLQRVGTRLVRASARPGIRYSFRILNSDDINAYALPGGFVYVTRGLLETVGDEGELAGVLAHEIGHIAARQHAAKIRRSQLASLGAGLLGPAVGGGVKVAAAVRGGRSGARGLFLRFTREDEEAADRLAAKNLYNAGYDPLGMVRFLGRLAALEEDQSQRVKRFFATHRGALDRRDTIADLIATFPEKPGLRADGPEFAPMQARLREIRPPGALPTSEAAAAILEAAEEAPDSLAARHREVASIFAPVFYHGIGEEPRYDYFTNFDFDGDWRGDNNWENAAKAAYPLRAWIYYAVRETRSHFFLHYAAFHPRDYKGGLGKGRFLSRIIRTAAKPAASIDPTNRAQEAVLAHENDLEGCLLVVEKNGPDPRSGKVVFVETLAHNQFLKYLPEGAAPRQGFGAFYTEGRRVKLYIEPRGHGIEALQPHPHKPYGTLRIFTYTGVAEEPTDDQTAPVGYNLVPMETTLWAEAVRGINPTYAETEDYGILVLELEDAEGEVHETSIPLGRIGSAFRGQVGGANMSRPPWGWFDGKDRSQPLGQWFFDPARAIRLSFGLSEDFSAAYLDLWPSP